MVYTGFSASSAAELWPPLRRWLGALAAEALWRWLARLGRYLPDSRARLSRVEILRDIPYQQEAGQAELQLDIYRPHGSSPPWPVVLHAHGGGFRILSKDSHWLMGAIFAQQGYIVFNIDYRLAPPHPFPAAIADCCAALCWVHRHAASYGGDASRLVLAGESAGANLVTSLAVAASYRRPEPWARAVWDAGILPVALVPACGLLQVTDTDRFRREQQLSTFALDRLLEVEQAYLGRRPRALEELDLVDPLRVLERGEPPQRPLPPVFAGVGLGDPLYPDTRRLRAALDQLGVPCEDRYYPGEGHAFQALIFRSQARRYWEHCFAFLARHGLPG